VARCVCYFSFQHKEDYHALDETPLAPDLAIAARGAGKLLISSSLDASAHSYTNHW
jgi:hypothetical protein